MASPTTEGRLASVQGISTSSKPSSPTLRTGMRRRYWRWYQKSRPWPWGSRQWRPSFSHNTSPYPSCKDSWTSSCLSMLQRRRWMPVSSWLGWGVDGGLKEGGEGNNGVHSVSVVTVYTQGSYFLLYCLSLCFAQISFSNLWLRILGQLIPLPMWSNILIFLCLIYLLLFYYFVLLLCKVVLFL